MHFPTDCSLYRCLLYHHRLFFGGLWLLLKTDINHSDPLVGDLGDLVMQGSYVEADPGPKPSPPKRKAFLNDVGVRK